MKKKKKLLEISSFYTLTKNHNHVVYGSWDMWDKSEKHIFLSFWAIFCTFTPLTTLKIKIFKKLNKPTGDIILQMFTLNNNYMIYDPWDMECDMECILPLITTVALWQLMHLDKWAQVHELPQSHCGNDWEGTLFL